MTPCPDPSEWVLYAAGEVPAPRREELDGHLAACEACRGELEALRRGLEALEALGPPPPVRAEALRGLRQRLADEGRRRQRPRRPRQALRWLGAAAAAAAAIVVALAVLLAPEPQPLSWPDEEQVDGEIADIAATLDLLESDTSVVAWTFEPQDEPSPPESPPGQSRSGPADAGARHG